ncbi:MAG TPA: hypothetical protein VHY34_00470 [Caulobacteraceae bacterium]|jgi:hypothetical protein|nr:hypothetical protein [Caulobacteraceae bacterium]
MKALAIGAAVVVLGLPTLAVANDPVAGEWRVNGRVDGKDFVVNCHFDRHGDALSGACFDGGTDQRHPLISGAVNGDQVKWTYQSHYLLIKFDVLYDGKLDGGSMKGSVGTSGHVGAFTAIKQ